MVSSNGETTERAGWTGPPGDPRSYFVADRYRYESGGLGIVYRASVATTRCNLPPDTRVAVKIFTGDISPERFEKLRSRGTALSQVVHPNLARFVEAFYGPPFINPAFESVEPVERLSVQVWVEGDSLANRCETASASDILEWGRQAGEALDSLHADASGRSLTETSIRGTSSSRRRERRSSSTSTRF